MPEYVSLWVSVVSVPVGLCCLPRWAQLKPLQLHSAPGSWPLCSLGSWPWLTDGSLLVLSKGLSFYVQILYIMSITAVTVMPWRLQWPSLRTVLTWSRLPQDNLRLDTGIVLLGNWFFLKSPHCIWPGPCPLRNLAALLVYVKYFVSGNQTLPSHFRMLQAHWQNRK